MMKLLKIILCAIFLFLAFLLGVRYSEPTKNLSNWIFEAKEKEIEFEELKEDVGQENINQIDTTAPTNPVVTLEQKAVVVEDPNKTIEKKAVEAPATETKTTETKTLQEPNSINE